AGHTFEFVRLRLVDVHFAEVVDFVAPRGDDGLRLRGTLRKSGHRSRQRQYTYNGYPRTHHDRCLSKPCACTNQLKTLGRNRTKMARVASWRFKMGQMTPPQGLLGGSRVDPGSTATSKGVARPRGDLRARPIRRHTQGALRRWACPARGGAG